MEDCTRMHSALRAAVFSSFTFLLMMKMFFAFLVLCACAGCLVHAKMECVSIHQRFSVAGNDYNNQGISGISGEIFPPQQDFQIQQALSFDDGTNFIEGGRIFWESDLADCLHLCLNSWNSYFAGHRNESGDWIPGFGLSQYFWISNSFPYGQGPCVAFELNGANCRLASLPYFLTDLSTSPSESKAYSVGFIFTASNTIPNSVLINTRGPVSPWNHVFQRGVKIDLSTLPEGIVSHTFDGQSSEMSCYMGCENAITPPSGWGRASFDANQSDCVGWNWQLQRLVSYTFPPGSGAPYPYPTHSALGQCTYFYLTDLSKNSSSSSSSTSSSSSSSVSNETSLESSTSSPFNSSLTSELSFTSSSSSSSSVPSASSTLTQSNDDIPANELYSIPFSFLPSHTYSSGIFLLAPVTNSGELYCPSLPLASSGWSIVTGSISCPEGSVLKENRVIVGRTGAEWYPPSPIVDPDKIQFDDENHETQNQQTCMTPGNPSPNLYFPLLGWRGLCESVSHPDHYVLPDSISVTCCT